MSPEPPTDARAVRGVDATVTPPAWCPPPQPSPSRGEGAGGEAAGRRLTHPSGRAVDSPPSPLEGEGRRASRRGGGHHLKWGPGANTPRTAFWSALAFALLAAPVRADSDPPADLAARAEAAFAAGVAARGDASSARPHFRAAAAAYDALWGAGFRNPAVGLNRARVRRLAGDLPGAVAALHEALALARYDRALQVELEDARAAVEYPHAGDLAGQCRPDPVRTVGARMSAAEAFLLAGAFALAAGLAAARFAMTRAAGWLGVGGLALLALAALGGLWWQDERDRARRGALPLVVVADEAVLRRGNADSYPPRLDPRLPRGVEARALGRRGGWVQVELAGGAAGWLPETAVIPVER